MIERIKDGKNFGGSVLVPQAIQSSIVSVNHWLARYSGCCDGGCLILEPRSRCLACSRRFEADLLLRAHLAPMPAMLHLGR